MKFSWPEGFEAIPEGEWTREPVESLALKYDTVENHGWYENLEPTLDDVVSYIRAGSILIDYSGGTGIFVDRLLHRVGDLSFGVVIVDSSAKFLRLALDKLGHDGRVAFRLIRYLKGHKRLELVEEVLDPSLLARGADGLVSTNAIHLYYDLEETLASWARVMRPGGRAFVQSGNMRNPAAKPGEWIIDETIEAIHEAARAEVLADPRYERYRGGLEDPSRSAAYKMLREKYFLPVRPVDHYLDALRGAGFRIASVRTATIPAPVEEWYEFVSVYHEGVLGWVGGAEKIEGRAASEEAVRDRLELMRRAMDRVFLGRRSFDCCWSYIICEKPER